MQIRVDFHTHSQASPDGGLRARHYRRMIDDHQLAYIAVTDHNTVEFAQELHAELGDRIIVGEEITTAEGEVIGLYLAKPIEPGQPLLQTVRAIRAQNGLVYIPHPFETVRKGVTPAALDSIAQYVDIIEIQNGRAIFQNYGKQAAAWAAAHQVAAAAGSDAHGPRGWGKTYTMLEKPPTRDTLVALLHKAQLFTAFPGAQAILYPKVNRLRKKLTNHV